MTEDAEGGGGDSRLRTDGTLDDPSLVRHEEEAVVDTRWEEVSRARVRREVSTRTVRDRHPREVEQPSIERVAAGEGDSGEIEVLEDGSVSIPVFEEELVVTRRRVLRERVIVRKELATDWQTVEVELRREHVAFDPAEAG